MDLQIILGVQVQNLITPHDYFGLYRRNQSQTTDEGGEFELNEPENGVIRLQIRSTRTLLAPSESWSMFFGTRFLFSSITSIFLPRHKRNGKRKLSVLSSWFSAALRYIITFDKPITRQFAISRLLHLLFVNHMHARYVMFPRRGRGDWSVYKWLLVDPDGLVGRRVNAQYFL